MNSSIANRNIVKPCLAALLLVHLAFAFPSTCSAAKIWKSPTDGYWRDGTNWSGNLSPDSTSFIDITTNNGVTITIDALTDATNLTVQKLTLGGPPGATNMLFLNNAGTNNPLVFQSGLELQDGAVMRITNSALLVSLTNNHVNLDGALTLDSGSITFEGGNTVTARVGRVTSGTLTINSGTVSFGTVTVGGLTNSSGVVNMNGGTFNISSLFSIGRNLGTTGLVSVLGGQLGVLGDDTRVGDSGVGQLTISNATAWLTNLYVGRDALSAGILTLQNGGTTILSNDLSIARFSGSTGTVLVTGGQLAAIGQKIYVGREGDGQMTLSDGVVQAASLLIAANLTNSPTGNFVMSGGSLNLSSNLFVGSSGFSTGQVIIAGGMITLTNPAAMAILSVPSGTLTLNAGTLTTDSVRLTNGAGQFVFNGGILNTKSTTVTNGVAFIVGDGADAATLHLDGGTHSFANGLIISSNATLNGCGTIIGTIVNHGTIATNCGVALVRPAITGQKKTGATNTISFTTVNGQTYTLEFKNALTDALWTALTPPTNGNGSVVTLKDTTATTSSRFYHVRAQ
jgi:T5SS/PEP-CTERM-associated repeat protein